MLAAASKIERYKEVNDLPIMHCLKDRLFILYDISEQILYLYAYGIQNK